MKKLISVIMTMIMVVSTTIMGFAENIILENSKTGIMINEVYYTEAEFRELLESIEFVGESQNTKSTRIVPAIAIPAWAIGTWVVPVAGTIITVIVAPSIMKVGGKVIDSTSQTFRNILDAIKQFKESNDEKKSYNLKADKFISKFRKASIRRQFPSEMLPFTVEEIQKKSRQGDRVAKTAWKLLTDGRFKK